MNAILARNLEIPRFLLAILVVIVGGFWGMVALFSDYPLDSSYAEWVVYVLGIHAFVGFPEIRTLENEFLPADDVAKKYAGSIGFKP